MSACRSTQTYWTENPNTQRRWISNRGIYWLFPITTFSVQAGYRCLLGPDLDMPFIRRAHPFRLTTHSPTGADSHRQVNATTYALCPVLELNFSIISVLRSTTVFKRKQIDTLRLSSDLFSEGDENNWGMLACLQNRIDFLKRKRANIPSILRPRIRKSYFDGMKKGPEGFICSSTKDQFWNSSGKRLPWTTEDKSS